MNYTFSGLLRGFGAQSQDVQSPYQYQPFMGQYVYVHGNSTRGAISVHSVANPEKWSARRETPTLFNATEVLLADARADIHPGKYKYSVDHSSYQRDDKDCSAPTDCLRPGQPLPASNPPMCVRKKCVTFRRGKLPFAYFMGQLVPLSQAPGIEKSGEQIRLLESPATYEAKFVSVTTGRELVSAQYLYFGPGPNRKMFNVRAVGAVFK